MSVAPVKWQILRYPIVGPIFFSRISNISNVNGSDASFRPWENRPATTYWGYFDLYQRYGPEVISVESIILTT